jgi:16S rRNA processing protein RimM
VHKTAWIAAARLAGTFGLHGELKCVPVRGDEGRVIEGATYALAPDGGGRTVTLRAVRQHHGRTVVALDGVTTEEAARGFVGRELFIAATSLALADGEYLDDDLVGLRIVDADSHTTLGTVARVQHYPVNDFLVVAHNGALIPLVREFVRAIDLGARTVAVALPVGLLDPAAADEA